MNKIQRRKYDKEYRIKNKERDREKIKIYQHRAYLKRVGELKGHPKKEKHWNWKGGVTPKEYLRKIRKKVIEALGNKCIKCGFSDYRALQIDHINGGGNKERKEMSFNQKFHNHVLSSIIKDEKKYQLLCANCNWIKRVENKESKGRVDTCNTNSIVV